MKRFVFVVVLFAVVAFPAVLFSETINVNGLVSAKVVKLAPAKLNHCKVYEAEVQAVCDAPKVCDEMQEKEVILTLAHSGTVTPNTELPNEEPINGGYFIEYLPHEPVKGNLSPSWTICKYERTAVPNPNPLKKKIGELKNSITQKENWKRASYFTKAGDWKIIYTVTLTGKDKNNASIEYKSSGSATMKSKVEGTKILVHTFEGAGARLGLSEKSIQNEFNQSLKTTSGLFGHIIPGLGLSIYCRPIS